MVEVHRYCSADHYVSSNLASYGHIMWRWGEETGGTWGRVRHRDTELVLLTLDILRTM